MFETSLSVGDIFQIILAAIGLYIAWREYERSRREKKDEQMRKETVGQVLSAVNGIEEKFDEIIPKLKMIKNITDRLMCYPSDKPQEWPKESLMPLGGAIKEVDGVIGYIEKEEFFSKIRKIYELLVLNEDKFSMSYGYSRYIDALREYLKLENMRNGVKDELNPIIQSIMNKEPLQPKVLINFLGKNSDFLEQFESQTENILSLIKELQIRYQKNDE